MCGKYSLTKQSMQICSLLCYVRKLLPDFRLKNGSNFRTLHNDEKICQICKAIFSVFYKISRPNFEILLLLKGSFREFRFLCLNLPRPEISLQGELSIVN